MPHFYLKSLFSLLLILLLNACATKKLQYAPEAKNWETQNSATDQTIKHRVYLIGETGNKNAEESEAVLALLKRKLDAASAESSVVFLGNNLSDGMPNKGDEKARDEAERQLDALLATLENFDGTPVFLPGNRDWEEGLKGVRRQEKYIQKALNKSVKDEDDWENYFHPEKGCGDPTVVEVSDQLVIIVVDSQWWLTDWDRESRINNGCEIKSKKEFNFFFEEVLRKYRTKNVIVASHHPIYSYGKHGGKFPAKTHLFPLTRLNKNLYLPLPVVGSVAAILSANIGSRQDLANQEYKDLKATMLRAADKNGTYIFASAHDKSLQYIVKDRQLQIISGGGSDETTEVKLGASGRFGYSHEGFAELYFYEDGSGWLQFWITDAENPEGKVIFREQIKGPLEISEENIPEDFPDYTNRTETVTDYPIRIPIEKKKGLHNYVMGKHYRELYTHQYTFPTLDLKEFKGGLKVIKRGGGNQTNSLRLADSEGQQYSMRDLTKDVSRLLPYPFNQISFAEDIVIDNFLSTHPFAATVIPDLAEAAKVYHTNPEIFYVPKQPTLGVHNDKFGGGFYLMEERPGGDWSNLASFGNSKKIISTIDLVDKLSKNNNHSVDQNWAVRSRLFDLVIGDWDRHDDQWRWARLKGEDGKKIYRPIPRDRDQAFSRYDGLLTAVIRIFPDGFLKQLRPYSKEIKKMKWATWSPRYFDRSFLNELTWEEWKKEAEYIRDNLTDEIIDQSFKDWPKKAQELTQEPIKEILKYRRDNIVEFARRHYLLVAKKADVYGTDERERFEITRLDDERTKVVVFEISNKKGKIKEKVYERIFLLSETKEIHVYGIGDDDEFIVTGEVNKGPILRLIGCQGKDKFVDTSKVRGLSKKTKVYDTPKGNILELGSEAKNKTTNKREVNIYDRRTFHYEYNKLQTLPILGYNPDNGLLLGVDVTWTIYNFKKEPYGQVHNLSTSYAVANKSFQIAYAGEFVEAFGEWDFLQKASFRAPRYALNFYGLGNQTTQISRDRPFHRVNQGYWEVNPAGQRRFADDAGRFIIGPFIAGSEIEATENRFISSDASGLVADDFEEQLFAGLISKIEFASVDNRQMTKRGLRLNANYRWANNLENSDDAHRFDVGMAFYVPLGNKENVVLASRLGSGHIRGQWQFFQAPTLGENSFLRGYRFDRFRANTSFYHNTDLRFQLFNSKNKIVPFTLGFFAGFDYGRVWLEGEDSDKWHSSYGGGLWIAPVDYLIFSGGYFKSVEDSRTYITVGFPF